MVIFEEAIQTVLSNTKILSTEKIRFTDSLGFTLAENIYSDTDMPPFDKSSMDGYACKFSDIKNELEILEIIPAGKLPNKSVGRNQCSKIMTGAIVPQGADCVIMIEQTEMISENTIRFLKESTFKNISYRGEDIKKGNVIIEKGTFIKPQHIALMSSVGCTNPLVYKKPIVAIIATGSELVEPDMIPASSQIRNSNAYQLCAQVNRIGAIPKYIGIAGDSEEETDRLFKLALIDCNVVLITGGVSAGDFDFVPKILKENNVNIIFEKVKIKPGKPTVFGIHEKCLVFGLPGNPVASYILFEVMVKQSLRKMMGNIEDFSEYEFPIGIDFKRNKADRLAWIPARLDENSEIIPVDYNGSAHLHSLNFADFVFPINIGVFEIIKGEKVKVKQI